MSRIRAGEWIAAVGAAGLLVVLFFDWFGLAFKHAAKEIPLGGGVGLVGVRAHSSLSGWSTLGWFMDVLLVVAIVGGLALPYMVAKRTSPAWPVGAAVLTIAIASAVLLVLIVRLLSLAGDEGPLAIGVKLPAYLGLVFAALIPVGAFLSLKDERTDSAEARDYVPPPARTAPGT
jgi:hypothetical protein